MKKFLLLVLLFFFFILSFTSLKAQQPPCYPNYLGLTFEMPPIVHTPQLRTDMPLEVLIAYIFQDSLCNSVFHSDSLKNFCSRQIYDDTMKYILKYYYFMTDYDPILYANTCMYSNPNPLDPEYIKDWLEYAIYRSTKSDFYLYMATIPQIILRVMVTDTVRRIMPGGEKGIEHIVTAEITDTIKGKILPECKDISIPQPITKKNDVKNKILTHNKAKPGDCIQFSYCQGRQKGQGLGGSLVDSTGEAWVKKDKEYLVFLKYTWICKDSANFYYSLDPAVSTWMYSMYPIENGNLIDPYNEFKLGTNPPVNAVINMLRSRINEIRTFGN